MNIIQEAVNIADNAVEYAIANKVAFCFVFFCVCKYGMNREF